MSEPIVPPKALSTTLLMVGSPGLTPVVSSNNTALDELGATDEVRARARREIEEAF